MNFNKIILNHIPLWRGQKLMGVRYGPSIIDSMIRNLFNNDVVIDSHLIDEKILNKTNNPQIISNMIQNNLENIFKNHKQGELIINLGGDHGISVGSIPPMVRKYPDLKVLWFDAHADINSPRTSLSGNFHGMPVNLISELYMNNSPLLLRNLSYFGIRDLDLSETEIIKNENINYYSSKEINKNSIQNIIDDVNSYHNLENSKIHLSIDIDGLDPKYCPSTGTPSVEGMELDDVCEIVNKITKIGEIVSLDLVEFNPLIGNEEDVEKTYNSIERILVNILKH